MSNDVVLGIDLGTTNSVVAVSDGGQARVLSNELGHRLVPSVVSFKPGGGVLVGEEARERRLLDASNTVYSVKRLIGRPYRSPEVRTAQERFAFEIRESPTGGVVVGIRGDTYTLTEISAFVLREVARVAELSMGKVSKAVITVPANFNELQRSATKAAGRVAGLDVLRIINEPTAAALAYGYGKDRPERVAVFDLGGGTFDVTILDLENDVFEVISTAGDSFLGGDDVDLLIAEAMCDTFLKQHRWDPRADRQAYERLRAAAEWAKCQLSADDAVELTVEELHYGPGGKPLDLEFEMSRQELERAVQPLLARSFDVCQDAFKEAGMKATDVDSVVLVGGSTRMPLVRSMVTEYFQKEPRDEIDPDLVVAQGAAIHGFVVGGQSRKRRQSLGRVALKKVSSKEVARLKQERKSRQDALPKQPAFAPTAQVDKPRPKAIASKAKRPAPPPLAPPAKVPGNDQLTRVAAIPVQEGATRVAPSPLSAGTPMGSDDALTRVAAIPDAPGQDATRVAGRPPPPPVPQGKKRPSPPRVALTKRKRPKKTQLGVGALPPPVPTRGFDEEEETVRHKDADALIAQAAGPAGPPPVRPKLIPTDGSGAHNFSDHEVTTTADLDVDALMAAGMAEAKEPRGPKGPPAPPQVPAPPSAEIGFDAPPALPGVVASPVVSVGSAKADHSQVDMQLKDFLREEPSQPFPLRQRVDTQDGAYGAIEDSPTSVRESPYEAAQAPEAAWEGAGLDGLGLDGGAAHPPADPFGAPPPVQTAQGHAFDVPPVPGLEGEGFELPSLPPEDPALGADAFELPSTPPMEEAPIPAIELGNRPAPLLMDVTPHSLGIETVGGFCQYLLRRNAPIPAEQTRIFSTASDNQEGVTIRVCQGEEKTFSYNQFLGEVHLEGLRKAPRGKVQINVAFQLDASGTLVVRAVDMDTGAEQRIRINLLGGASEEEIEAMRSRQQQMLGA